MKGVFLIFIAFTIMAFVYSKPIMIQESGFKLGEFEASIKKINNLSKRAVEPSSSGTGFAKIMSTQERQRESWSNQCEFFVSSLGLAVGLGNIWRFPYVCYQNGGGTFLIPYIMMLIFVGIPALFFEQSTGQYARVGVNKVFTIFVL